MAFTIHLLATLCLIQLSTAQECRNVASVINSARDPQTNVNAGGHIWQHINGLSAKPVGAASSDTQLGKTLFNSETDFTNAYTAARGLTTGTFMTCPTSGASGTRADAILASSIGVSTARLCTSVNDQRLCNASTSYSTMGRNVIFCYKYVSSQWIMRTAYPKFNAALGSSEFAEDTCSEDIFLTGDMNGSGTISSSIGAILLMSGLVVPVIGLF